MPPRARTIKVSEEEYQLLQRARLELSKKGYQRLNIEREAREEVGTDLEELIAGLALGAVAAAGVILILKALSDPDENRG